MPRRSQGSANGEHLPIRVILPSQGEERKVPPGGPSAEPFRPVDREFRDGLLRQVGAALETVRLAPVGVRAVPLRVQLIPRAIAKSHRPHRLFSSKSCPIVGAGKLGELFIKATPQGLDSLSETIRSGESRRLVRELSCVEAIEPVSASFRQQGLTAQQLLENCPRGTSGFVVRVKLFTFEDKDDQASIVRDFERVCRSAGLRADQAGYSPSSGAYSVEISRAEDVQRLSGVVGIRSIAPMPTIRSVRPMAMNPLPLGDVPARDQVLGEVPIVAVVDSGVTNSLVALESWVVGRESAVAPQYRNTEHGTFVAGLIVWGSQLNPIVRGMEESPCEIFDLQVLPNDDPGKGEIEHLREQEFLITLENAVRKHSKDIKVWNLSLGTDTVCSLDEFSPLAEELDNLQEKYGVTFVISAGNYTVRPLLDFPRTAKQIAPGRITVPADSVLGIAVGAVSHVDYRGRGPSEHEPAPYSRHGAGPNYVIKPDLVHYGGSCSIDAAHRTGIRSVCEVGSAENLGTSFAAPLVSSTLAQIYHQITPSPSPVLARALLIHHARDPRTGQRVPDGDEDCFGFGRPSAAPDCLDCSPHSSTIVFDDAIRPGYYLEWDDFPYPPSLTRNGRFFGEIWMTVAFAPVRGSRWGSEYCETHIDASFGVFFKQTSRKSGIVSQRYKGLVPPEHKNPGILYESYQVAKLRKWAPVRTYYGNLGPTGKRGERWRLTVRLLTRHGVEVRDEKPRQQPFSLILTIADPTGQAPVYDEMARGVASRFQSQSLAVRAAPQVRASIQE